MFFLGLKFRYLKSRLLLLACTIFLNHLSAQILSIAPGMEFNVKGGTTMVAGRADFNLSGDFTFTNNSLYVDLVPNKINGLSTMQRVYKFTNTVYYMQGRINLNYLESELNGIPESELKFLYNNGLGWQEDYNSTVNTNINLVEGGAMNYTKLDAFTAGKYLATDEIISVRANPNPSTTEFNVMVMAKGQAEIELTVMDARGAIVETKKTRPYQNIKVGRNLPNGTYVIRAIQGNKPIAAIRVVKM
jgi:hypothetical protein